MNTYQVITICVVFVILILSIYWIFKDKGNKVWAIAFIGWSIHTLIFYFMAIVFGALLNEHVNLWSSVLRVHSAITILVAIMLPWIKEEKIWI